MTRAAVDFHRIGTHGVGLIVNVYVALGQQETAQHPIPQTSHRADRVSPRMCFAEHVAGLGSHCHPMLTSSGDKAVGRLHLCRTAKVVVATQVGQHAES